MLNIEPGPILLKGQSVEQKKVFFSKISMYFDLMINSSDYYD
jgi:hypothetical protein